MIYLTPILPQKAIGTVGNVERQYLQDNGKNAKQGLTASEEPDMPMPRHYIPRYGTCTECYAKDQVVDNRARLTVISLCAKCVAAMAKALGVRVWNQSNTE